MNIEECGYRLFSVEEAEIYDKYASRMNGNIGATMQLANLIAWSHYTTVYYKEIYGFLNIIVDEYETKALCGCMPMGDYTDKDNLAKAIEDEIGAMEAQGCKTYLYPVKEWMLPYLDELEAFTFEYTNSINDADYLYKLSDIDEDNRKSKKRYYYNFFISNFEPNIREYTAKDYQYCMQLIDESFCSRNECEDCFLGCQKVAFKMLSEANLKTAHFLLIESKKYHKLLGYVVFIESEKEILYIAKKSIREARGFSEYVNRMLVDLYGADEGRYMNYEDDMGVSGIRMHKEQLSPHMLSMNMSALVTRRN